MRIARADVTSVAAEFPEPLRFSEKPMRQNTAVVVHLEDAEGLIGFGYAPTFNYGTGALHSLIEDDFVPRILQRELDDTAGALAAMADAAAISGRLAGLARHALAVVEMALLDLEAQLADVPLHGLWGQPAASVRAYASGGWRFLDVDELIRFVEAMMQVGFSAVKIQVGLSPDEDADRLRALRDAFGPELAIMLDANLRIPADHGREWLAALAPFDPVWLEEPLATHDHAKLAQLRRASTISIAAGESESEPSELADLVSRQAVDFIQPDIHRVGLGAASNVCRQARDTDVAVAPHMAHEVSAHLLSGLPGDGWLEYFNWFEQWWETPVVPLEGWITPLPVAGHGVRLRPGWLESHAI